MNPQATKARATGGIPSPADYRDRMAAATVVAKIEAQSASLPTEFTTKIDQFKVLDQNKISACVSHAWALVMMYWWYQKTGEIVDFSPRFLDILSDQPWIPIDGGRVPRDVCKVSAQYGCCTTALLPNDTDNLTHAQYRDKNVITPAMYAEAIKYKIPGYVRIGDDTVIDFRRGVKNFGLVSGLFAISDAFWLPSWAAKDINPLRTKLSTSNHQMVVNGFKGDLNDLSNCWSEWWCDGGNAQYNASEWLPYVYEGWSIVDIPQDVKYFLSNLPAQGDFHFYWNKNLQRGDYNDDVKYAQIALMILGHLQDVPPDQLGYYGPKTSQAVLAFQASIGVPVWLRSPNHIGPKTRAGLNARFTI